VQSSRISTERYDTTLHRITIITISAFMTCTDSYSYSPVLQHHVTWQEDTDIPDKHTPSDSHDCNTNSTASNYECQLSEYTEHTHE